MYNFDKTKITKKTIFLVKQLKNVDKTFNSKYFN